MCRLSFVNVKTFQSIAITCVDNHLHAIDYLQKGGLQILPLHLKNSKTMTSCIKEKAEDYDDEAGQRKQAERLFVPEKQVRTAYYI